MNHRATAEQIETVKQSLLTMIQTTNEPDVKLKAIAEFLKNCKDGGVLAPADRQVLPTMVSEPDEMRGNPLQSIRLNKRSA